MAETALKFGPQWLRELSHGSNTISPPPLPSVGMPLPKYSLAEFRYGREEMLALFPKDPKLPDSLAEFPQLLGEKCQLPLALIPVTEEEQRIWSRSVNSDAVLRTSGKNGPGNGMSRNGRGGSVDRGRGRGRGGYYQRGLSFEDDDGPPGGFSRPKPIERSQSASEKDQRWDDRDRRFDRTFSGRGGVLDDNNSIAKQEGSRASSEHWRKYEKDEDYDWRSSGLRSSDKTGGRGSWRTSLERDRNREIDRPIHNRSSHVNGTVRHLSHHPTQKSSSGHVWDDDVSGNNLPEWSVEESNETDIVGTFDSSGAFLETKVAENTSTDEIYASDDADEGDQKDSPEAKRISAKKTPHKSSKSNNGVGSRNSVKQSVPPPTIQEETLPDKPSETSTEPYKNQNTVKTKVEKAPKNVIKTCTVSETCSVSSTSRKPPEYVPVSLPNVPEVVQKSTKSDNVVSNSVRSSESLGPTTEEDAFAHHKKATENMVAQWTEEEEQRVISQSDDILPTQHENSNKWFYQDPQGELQGPFTSPEMLEWFSAGYFTMGLMVRRGCDAKFSQLGELIKTWGRVPFMPGNSPAPIRVTPIAANHPTPMNQTIVPNPVTAPSTSQLPKQDDQLRVLQQQMMQQQLMQQQLMLRQAQLQTLFGQLKQQDNFTSLNPQQQQHVLLQQFMAQQQLPRPNLGPMGDQKSILESMTPLTLPVLGLPIPPLLKNDLSLWNVAPGTAGSWPLGLNPTQPPTNSIWDTDVSKQKSEESDLEKQARVLAEEQEKRRKAEELRLEEERQMEEQRKQEELKRKQEEERLLKELQKQEEEKKRQEELQRHHEEEQRRQEELRQIEEQKRKEEELRKQEELQRIEEQKRLEELRRQEELSRKEEQKRMAELKKQEELRKQEELCRQEELQKKREEEKQLEQYRLKELEREAYLKREQEKQREKEEVDRRKLQELNIKAQYPAWGIPTSKACSELSLCDIQRLQEEKEREEREEKMRQQIVQQQQSMKQVQQNKNGLNWAKRSNGSNTAVKTLLEIQQEEAERLVQQQRTQKPQMLTPAVNSNVGVWGNASHLNRITSAPQTWNANDESTSGFWDDALHSTSARKSAKTNDSAFPALANPVQPASVISNKSKNVRARKEEDVVTRLFGTHRKPTDDFTLWCTDALSSLPSSVDVPTFVAFLKDVESPYEVYDYVKSYLGEGKEPREFAKQFLERRSKYRNQAKQMPAEENMWGPAPAITPTVNKLAMQTANDCDGNSSTKGKTKKRKNRMQKLDNSMLGFTVQSNPDRLNVGEIDHVEGM